MGSAGLARNGAGLVPALQRGWTAAVEGNLQAHDDKLDVLKGVAEGVAAGVSEAVERARPTVILCVVALSVGSLSLLGLFALRVAELLR